MCNILWFESGKNDASFERISSQREEDSNGRADRSRPKRAHYCLAMSFVAVGCAAVSVELGVSHDHRAAPQKLALRVARPLPSNLVTMAHLLRGWEEIPHRNADKTPLARVKCILLLLYYRCVACRRRLLSCRCSVTLNRYV